MRAAITLVEVVVSLGIVAVLAAIVIPSVQMAREAARKTQCQNNVRQVGLSMQAFHSAERELPSFYNGSALEFPLREWDLFHMHSWRVPLLPYLEQENMHAEIDFGSLATAPENERVRTSVLSVYVCPSGRSTSDMGWGLRHEGIGGSEEITEADKYYVVRSDYDAIAGIQVLPDELPPDVSPSDARFVTWGIWGRPEFDRQRTTGSHLVRYQQGRYSDVTDGLSNTISLAERGGRPYAMKNGKLDVTSDNPDAIYPGQVGWLPSNTFAWAINQNGVGINENNSAGIYSLHAGGATVGVADGSVKFLSDSLDYETLVRLLGRADGGVVTQ